MGALAGQRVVVVGKRSAIGAAWIAYAQSRGAEVIAVSAHECDFRDPDAVSRFFSELGPRPCAVVFCAVINKSASDSYQTFLDNLQLVRSLIEHHGRAAVESVIYFSSVDVYGRRPRLPIMESNPLDPDGWYALAKSTSEWMLRQPGAMSCPVTILRIPGVYGPGLNDRSVIGRMVASARGTGRIVVTGTGCARRDYVWREDVCRLLERLIPLRLDDTLNVATGQSRPIAEIARLVRSMVGDHVAIAHSPLEEAREFDLVFETNRLRSVVPNFEFCPLEQAIASYREAGAAALV